MDFHKEAELFKVISDAVKAEGGGDEDLQRLISDARLAKRVAKIIVDKVFIVVVDYGQTLEEMIRAGRYDFVDSDIKAEHFPIRGEGKVQRSLVLVDLGYWPIGISDVLDECKRRGLRPAGIEDLLAFGATFPEAQCKFIIMALGSIRRQGNYHFIPCLSGHKGWRELSSNMHGHGWRGRCRFLAIRD